MSEWVGAGAVALLALAVVALAVVEVRDRSRRHEELAAAYALIADLQERVGLVEAQSVRSADPGAPASASEGAIVITRIADPEPHAAEEVDRRIDGSLFADLVLRESLVKGISLAYGIGRALSPETRNRIRFLMRQEVKRSRKQRRADLRAARRHLADQRRAEVPTAAPGEDAA